jgi:hypothetical protein
MKLPEGIEGAITEARARVRTGYPWWLRRLLMRDVVAITLGRRIYLGGQLTGNALERLLRHELAHVRQINRLGIVRFYVLYATEFLRHFWRVRSIHRAYTMISFEREAVAAEQGL